jgi:NADH-quinone oxidoreductase subunit E/NADP-reducing hydrogenase subunit HndA
METMTEQQEVATGSKMQTELINFINEKHQHGYYNAALMSILHKAQEIYGYISDEAIDTISLHMGIPTARIWGIVTFYHYFTLKPRGKYVVSICLGTACYVKGSKRILNKLKEILGISLNETTQDGLFTIEAKYCLGCCGLAPVMMVNDKVYEKLTTKKISEIVDNLKSGSLEK